MADGYMNGVEVRVDGEVVGQLSSFTPNENGDAFRLQEIPTISNPTIRLEDIRTRRFNVIDEQARVTEEDMVNIRNQIENWHFSDPNYVGLFTTRQDIMVEEDRRIFEALDELAQPMNLLVDGYWAEFENQDRETCLFCDGELEVVTKDEVKYKVCKECDRR